MPFQPFQIKNTLFRYDILLNTEKMLKSENMAQIANLVEFAVRDSIEELSPICNEKEVDIIIFDASYNMCETANSVISATATNHNSILFGLNLKSPSLTQKIDEQLYPVLSHEIHHCYRRRFENTTTRVIDILVTEGQADYFSRYLSLKYHPEFSEKLSPIHKNHQYDNETIYTYKELLKREILSEDINIIGKWQFSREGIPNSILYILALRAIEQFIEKHKQINIQTLLTLPSEEFISCI